jgi:septal ring factor EnvC (AmiA/AmiB activator)
VKVRNCFPDYAIIQELIHKVQEQDQEILRLRKYLADYSTKEVQIRNEKYVLEKRIAHMRSAFDQQQQDLVDAASKALSYRQEIIEENIRLTYALQAAEQERSLFVSILLPLLSEYSLHPQISDSQSIVSSVKVLFRHLQEKLNVTETKLKETEYQLAPWQSDVNHSNASPLSPYQPVGVGLRYSVSSYSLMSPQFS